MKLERGIIATGAGLIGCAALYGCASYPIMNVAPPSQQSGAEAVLGDAAAAGRGGRDAGVTSPVPQASLIPGIAPARASVPPATAAEIASIVPDEPLNAVLPPQPLAQYLNTVFAEVLRVPYSLGPGLGARTDIITVNAPAATSRRQYVALLQGALRNYGLTLSVSNGAFQVTEEGASTTGGQAPRVVRSRSSADTPTTGQVIQFFQLVALRADGVLEFVRSAVGSGVSVEVDLAANALLFSGSGRNVAAAVDLVHNLDQPAFAGSQVVRLQPVFWAPDAFAQALAATLTAEGYVVSTDPLGPKSVMIVPLVATNQTLAFAADAETMSRVQYWAAELDQPSLVGDANSTFVYDVQNTSASIVGEMLVNASQGGGGTGTAARGANTTAAAAVGAPGGQAAGGRGGAAANTAAGRAAATNAAAGAVPTGGSITVDTGANRILFTGSAAQFAQLRTLLRQLDRPARQVLVEVTVAEVTLTDETRAGLEFFFTASGSGTYTGGTRSATGTSGLDLGVAGLNVAFDNGTDLQAAFNAFASNNKVNILSRPRLTARSGTAASINVGAQVPIIIGQRAANTGTGNGTDADVTQQIQYRDTGVILEITPTVYGDDRVDIEINQEVSSARDNPNPAIQSPIIDQRTVTTTLSLADGHTAVLGGMIQDSYSKGNNGVPFLKDLPLFGQAFRVDSISGAKTELVVLITPFIIRDDADMASMAQQATTEINNAFRTARGSSYTLTPWAGGLSIAGDPPNPNVTAANLRRPEAVEAEVAD